MMNGAKRETDGPILSAVWAAGKWKRQVKAAFRKSWDNDDIHTVKHPEAGVVLTNRFLITSKASVII